MNNINKMPYASWLEKTLQDVVDMPVESIYIITKLKGGATIPSFYNCNVNDKILFAGIIQQDAMMDAIKINGMTNDGGGEHE